MLFVFLRTLICVWFSVELPYVFGFQMFGFQMIGFQMFVSYNSHLPFIAGRMSRAPILIKDLVKGNQIWKMAIRVVDLWIVTEKNGYQHIEMVIQDREVI